MDDKHGGPTRWNGELEQEGHMYDEAKWNGSEAQQRLQTLKCLYGRMSSDPQDDIAYSVEDLFVCQVPPILHDMEIFEWLMFVDDWCFGQELRMAIQDGPWEWVDAEVRRILALGRQDSQYLSRYCLQ